MTYRRRPRRIRIPTPFEERVYALVRRIPQAQTRSYGWVARQLGNPGLARAVGHALHRNPDTRHTPCHRVIRSCGGIGGYVFGPARKLARLRREGWRPAVRSFKIRFVLFATHQAYLQ